jgi:ComF family protein
MSVQRGAPVVDRSARVLLDLLLPPRCTGCDALLRTAHAASTLRLCTRCAALVAPLPAMQRTQGPITARFDYDNPLGEAMTRAKYGGDLSLFGPLGRSIAEDPLWHAAPDGCAWDAITAVPMHRWRRIARGCDHTALLVRHGWHHRRTGPRPAALLVRTRNDPPQASLGARARRLNLCGAFAMRRGARVDGLRILVVDDVTTSGATLGEAIAVLLAAGAAHVHGLALLRSVLE